MAVGILETHRVAERRGARAVDELETAALLEQRRQRGDERRSIARVRVARPLPCAPAHDEARIREQQPRRPAVFERGEQAAGMIEVQMAQHDDVDVLMRDAALASERSSTWSSSSTP